MKITITMHSKRPTMGAGTRLKHAIAKVVDAMPIPAGAKRAIKGCAGCQGRAAALDRAETKVRRAIGLEGKAETRQDEGHGTG